MKKITLLLVIIFTLLFSTTSWGEWNYLIEIKDEKNSARLYYDRDRIRKSGKFIYFWELTDYTKRDPNPEFDSMSYKKYAP